jgi:hypothetical protein
MKDQQTKISGIITVLKKARLVATGVAFMFFAIQATAQQNKDNLFKNSELKANKEGKIAGWSFQGSFSSAPGYKGGNSICVNMDNKGRTLYQSTMTQIVKGLKSGKYIFSAYVKLDKKIDGLILCRIIEQNGKSVYETARTDASGQETDKWTKIMLEFNIPEGVDKAMIAFDLRDKSPGAKIWIDSPCLIYKAEQ